jgi:hypothetical protein
LSFPDEHFYQWTRAIYNLSRKLLTVKSDKIPSILALIQRFAKGYGVSPLAGLWYEDLHRGLLWFRCKRFDSSNSQPCYRQPREPSWSWAAIDDPIIYFNFQQPGIRDTPRMTRITSQFDIEVVHAEARYVERMSRDHLFRGHLEVWGFVVRVKITVDPLHDRPQSPRKLIKNNRENCITVLPVMLDIDKYTSSSTFYCLRVANWAEGSVCKESAAFDECCNSYYLLLETDKSTRGYPHPHSIGRLRRVGIGFATIEMVNEFFSTAKKKFMTIK